MSMEENEEKAKAALAAKRAAEASQKTKGVLAKLLTVQSQLRVTKDRGKGHGPSLVTYEYRNAEDILEAVKPLCAEVGAVVKVDVVPQVIGETIPAEIRAVGKGKNGEDVFALISGPRLAAVATASFVDVETGERETATSFAFIDAWRKGQTEPEKLCGSADSYASKYALGHLFAIDNNRDADMESDGRSAAPATRPDAPSPF